MKNHYEIRGDITAIFMTYKGKRFETVVDTEDLDKCLGFPNTWRVRYLKSTNMYYVQGSGDRLNGKNQRQTIHLHRWLMGEPEGYEIDHKNNNGLDNRRSVNLRKASKSENAQNRKGAQVNSKSGIRGVCWHKTAKKWVVQSCVKGSKKYHGVFESLEEAARIASNIRSRKMPFSKEASTK